MTDLPERVRYRDLPVDHYVDALREGVPWAIARWSDGDWPCVLGETKPNTDGHARSPKLRADLIEVLLEKPTYHMAIQPFLLRQPGRAQQVHDWLVAHDLSIDWVDGDVFCRALTHDRLQPFIDELRRRSVILVGPARMMKMIEIFPIRGRVTVPDVNCHDEYERVFDETCQYIDTFGPEPVVSISAGMSANVLVHWLHDKYPDSTLIDIGSVWEPFIGVGNRTYHKAILERMRK